MPLIAARLRIRNSTDTADLLTIGMADLADWPDGDGTRVDIITGRVTSGSYVVRVYDTGILTAALYGGDGRPQLLSRRALLEVQTDGGAWVQRIGGYITRISIPDGYLAEIEVGETLRVPATARVPSATLGASINRGTLFGGPVITSWGPLASLGGWRATVASVTGRRVTMTVTQTYFPPRNVKRTTPGGIIEDVALAQSAMDPYLDGPMDGVEYGGIAPVNASATLLSARITRLSDAQVSVGTPRVVLVGSFLNPTVGTPAFTFSGSTVSFTVDVRTGDPLPAVSDLVTIACTTVTVTPDSPAYLDGHPIDVVATLYDSVGVRRNTASFAAVKDALGTSLRYAYRITAPIELQSWVEDSIAGPLGVAFLPDANGDVAATFVRAPLTSTPTTTIGIADVSGITTLYEHAESSSVARLVWEQDQYVLISDPSADDPADAVLTNRARQEFAIDQGTTFATRTLSYTIDGQFYLDGQWPGTPDVVSSGQRDALAARFGRGAARVTVRVRRDATVAAGLAIGAYYRCTIPSLPSGGVRLAASGGAARIVQVVGLGELAGEREVVLEDLGPALPVVSVVPTLSLAVSGQSYTVTLTNLAALNTAVVGVRFEVALTTGAAPIASQWALLRSLEAGALATVSGSVTFAPCTVWVRARAESIIALPGAWSTSVSAAVAGVGAVSTVTGTAVTGDGSKLAITWTGTFSTDAVFDVAVRLSSAPVGTGLFTATLGAGSTTATASGLTAGTLYSIDVRARAPFQTTGTWITTTATTDGAVVTLAAPTALTAFVPFSGFVALSGNATGTPLPDVEVEVAIETAVGSGTFGSYSSAGTATVAMGGAWQQNVAAAGDNKKRRLRARAVRAGATASSWVVAPTDVTPDNSGML